MIIEAPKEIEWDGNPVSETGIYKGVPIETYHGDTELFIGRNNGFSISSTGIRKLISRPSEYWCESPFNPNRFDTEEKEYFEFGKAAHMLLLGESGFSEKYVMQPEQLADPKTGEMKAWQGARTVCKDWTADAKAAGKSIITSLSLEKIKWMAEAMSKNPVIQAGVLSGKVERSLFVQMPQFWLRNRPDTMVGEFSGDLVDIKTAADVSYDGIQRAVYASRLDVQAAVARYAYEAIFGAGTFSSFTFVFIEKTPPFDVRVMTLKDGDLDRGTKQMFMAFKTLEKCLLRNEWPGYAGFEPDVEYIEMPTWAQNRIDNDILLGSDK